MNDEQVVHITKPAAPLADAELHSLFSLLDDPDMRIFSIVEEKLRSHGPSVIDPLVKFMNSGADTIALERAGTIIRDLNADSLVEEFSSLRTKLEEGRKGCLEEGVFLIARYGYPNLDVEYYKAELDALAGMLHERISGTHSPYAILKEANDFFFKEKRFRGNHSNFLEADNSYINQVIDRRLGIPISLSVLYILVAGRRLGLPISGASTPGHFLIRFDGIRDEPLFVDAFNDGIVLRRDDIRRFISTSGMPYYESFIQPSRPRNILLRMTRNLILLFEKEGNASGRAAFERFHNILLGNEAVS